MRKIASLALAVLGIAAPAAAAPDATPIKGVLESCHTGAGPLDRYAVFFAQMGTIHASKKLQLRFDLYQRLPGAKGFTPLPAPGLGVWRSSTADIFRYRKQVAGLQAPGAYRAVVRFRWLAADGTTLRTTRRTSATCRQPDPGADLAVGGVGARDAGSGRYQYAVEVRNLGNGDAGAFEVALTVGAAQQPTETVESLAAGARTSVTFVGPKCSPGEQLTVQLDPTGQVPESDRGNDRKVVQCPVAT